MSDTKVKRSPSELISVLYQKRISSYQEKNKYRAWAQRKGKVLLVSGVGIWR